MVFANLSRFAASSLLLNGLPSNDDPAVLAAEHGPHRFEASARAVQLHLGVGVGVERS